MFVKHLTPGQQFTTRENGGTVYTTRSLRVQDGFAYVVYTIGEDPREYGYPTRPLSTVIPV